MVNTKEVLKKGYVVVLDTNVLLSIYHYSPGMSEFALNCIKKIEEFIYLPATVKIEFLNHCAKEFSKMKERNKQAYDIIQKKIEEAEESIIGSCDRLEYIQMRDTKELKDCLKGYIDNMRTSLSEYINSRKEKSIPEDLWGERDLLRELVKKLEINNRVMDEPRKSDIFRWTAEGERRYKKRIPPGFEDVKKKDGVRKYSDLILWKEILRFANEKRRNIIFITDDSKKDWWEKFEKDNKIFHSKLIKEFDRTGMHLIPMTSNDFYNRISLEYNIDKEDKMLLALSVDGDEFIQYNSDKIIDDITDDLIDNFDDFLDEYPVEIGSEGIEDLEIIEYNLTTYEIIDRYDNTIIYELIYNLKLEGISYDYLGKDEDTKEFILSPGINHDFEGRVTVYASREVKNYYDLIETTGYVSALIVNGHFHQTHFEER